MFKDVSEYQETPKIQYILWFSYGRYKTEINPPFLKQLQIQTYMRDLFYLRAEVSEIVC